MAELDSVVKIKVGGPIEKCFSIKKDSKMQVTMVSLLFLFLDFFPASFQATFSHQERPH